MSLIIIPGRAVAKDGIIFIKQVAKIIKDFLIEKTRSIARHTNKFINKYKNLFEQTAYEITQVIKKKINKKIRKKVRDKV